jgi:hypothetical protein
MPLAIGPATGIEQEKNFFPQDQIDIAGLEAAVAEP